MERIRLGFIGAALLVALGACHVAPAPVMAQVSAEPENNGCVLAPAPSTSETSAGIAISGGGGLYIEKSDENVQEQAEAQGESHEADVAEEVLEEKSVSSKVVQTGDSAWLLLLLAAIVCTAAAFALALRPLMKL